MIVKEIIKIFETKYPPKNAEEWDNVGLLVGNREKKVKKVQISIDATEKAIDYAIENDVDLILTHHPMIFKGIKSIDYSTVLGRKIIKLIKNDISLYAMHTNLDASKDGLNDYVTSLLGEHSCKIVDENINEDGVGIGRLFTLEKEYSIEEYADIIKENLHINNVKLICQDRSKKIKKVAVVNGSGMSYWRKVKSMGAQLFITGDVGYHEALDAKESGLNIIDIGHFESEVCFTDLLKKELADLTIEVIIYNDGPVFINY